MPSVLSANMLLAAALIGLPDWLFLVTAVVALPFALWIFWKAMSTRYRGKTMIVFAIVFTMVQLPLCLVAWVIAAIGLLNTSALPFYP